MPQSRRRSPADQPATGSAHKNAGRGSSLLVLVACAVLLGAGWVWLQGNPDAFPAEQDDVARAIVQEGPPATASEAASGEGLFGGLDAGNDKGGAEAFADPAPVTKPSTPVLTVQWLADAWVSLDGDCMSDTGLFFWANGSFSNLGREGSWSLGGDTLTVRYQEGTMDEETDPSAEWHTMRNTVRVLGPDRILFGTDKLKRCPLSR
jgi:hypothetical protein